MKAANMKAVECRQTALPHLRPPGERVEIPYEGKTLYGILRKPEGVKKPPIVVMAVGLDSTKEEGRRLRAVPSSRAAWRRSLFDGPGQGEGQYEFGIRGDYEVPVKAVIDYVDDAGDLDQNAHRHVGRLARRLLRAARRRVREAHQGLHRARRPVRLGRGVRHLAGLDASRPSWHAAAARRRRGEERRRKTLSLVGLAQNITCPIFIVNGRHDRVVPAGRRRAAGTRGERPGRTRHGRGRQPHRQQPRLSLAFAKRGLDGGAAQTTCRRPARLLSLPPSAKGAHMPATIFDSSIFRDIFTTPAMREMWSDENRVQKYLDFEAALARAQARLGIIPKNAAAEIVRHCDVKKMDFAKLKEQHREDRLPGAAGRQSAHRSVQE